MKDQQLYIPTEDKKNVFVVLSETQESKGLVILVHGLGGNERRYLMHAGKDYFVKNGYSVCRVNLYKGDEKTRELSDCTIQTHAQDIDTVVDYFKEDYEGIFMAGHSLGGPSMYYSRAVTKDQIKAIAYWDPSITSKKDAYFQWNAKLDAYVTQGRLKYVMPKKLLDSWCAITEDDILKMRTRSLFVFAGEGVLHDMWKPTLPKLLNENEIIEIEGASHMLDENNSAERVFESTLDWFNKG